MSEDADSRISIQRDSESLRPLSDVGMSDEVVWGLVDAAPDGIVMIDEGGRILLVNRQVEGLFGYDRSELLGRTVEELLPERLRQVHKAHRTRYRAEPRTRTMGGDLLLFGRRKDGAEFPVEISLSPLTTDSGLLVVAAVRDITARMAMEADARRVRELLDATRDAVFIFDRDTLRFSYVNQGAIEQVGYSRAELVAMTPLHIAPEFNEAELRERLSPLATGDVASTTFTTVHRRRDGADVPVEVVVQAPAADEDGGGSFVAQVRDISDRVETEARLRQAAQEMRLLEDRERIARDLHDIVIQRLFAAGMALQGVTSIVVEPDAVGRIDHVIDELDETIRELRTAIYGLQSQISRRGGLRAEILRVIAEERIALATEPRISFGGVVDVVPAEIAEHLVATLREALSNIARHAHAGSVEVMVEASEQVVLRVADDGVGLTGRESTGSGLRNMYERARQLGGSFQAQRRPVGGTVVEWAVPNRQG